MLIAGLAVALVAAAPVPQQDADAARAERVAAAITKLKAKDLDGALADFDKLIGEYRAQFSNEKRALFCAINDDDAARYEAAAARRKQPIRVIDSGYCFALWGKGYILADRRDFSGAAALLERATMMAPDYEQFLAELAYAQQSQGQWEKSVATYDRAASAAQLVPDAAKRTRGLLRAWWGKGYSLIELGRLDEAEAMFNKCLELDSTHEKSKDELTYIAQLRAKAKP